MLEPTKQLEVFTCDYCGDECDGNLKFQIFINEGTEDQDTAICCPDCIATFFTETPEDVVNMRKKLLEKNILTQKDRKILANLQAFKDHQIVKSRSCEGSGDCKSCNLLDCYYNETETLPQLNQSNENRLTHFLKDFKEHPERYHESKRIYRCPNCDAQVLEKVSFNSLHYCSCGAFTRAKNFKIEFEEMR